jgi:hypothetical protein
MLPCALLVLEVLDGGKHALKCMQCRASITSMPVEIARQRTALYIRRCTHQVGLHRCYCCWLGVVRSRSVAILHFILIACKR